MSERMTDERFKTLTDPEAGGWKDDEANEMAREAARARRVEDEQTEKIASRDITIKALADALEHVSKASVNERVWNDQTGAVDDMQKIVRAALRLAGRMP